MIAPRTNVFNGGGVVANIFDDLLENRMVEMRINKARFHTDRTIDVRTSFAGNALVCDKDII